MLIKLQTQAGKFCIIESTQVKYIMGLTAVDSKTEMPLSKSESLPILSRVYFIAGDHVTVVGTPEEVFEELEGFEETARERGWE